jgi:copper transport protein
MAVWLGGLVVLAAVGLRGTDPDAIRTVSRRFSRVALACVGVLVVTGAYQTWRLVGGLDALRDEEYGRILVIKLVVFAVMLVVASFSREIVQRIYGDAAPVPAVRGGALDLTDDAGVATAGGPADARAARREVARLRRSVWSEVALGALVLVVTALLVNAVPPADISGAGSATTGVTIEHPEVTLDVTATPGVAGLNDLHVSTYSPAGAPLDVAAVELTLALPGRGIAPLSVPLRELGPGHYLSPGLDLPLAGDWRLTATVRLGPVDRVDLAGDLPIR